MAKEVPLTYRGLADRLNIKLESARKTVRRKDWKRIQGSDGVLRILVPEDYLAEMGASMGGSPKGHPTERPGGNEVAMEFLEDALEIHGERLGPILRASIAQLDRAVIRQLVLLVASGTR
jgi:hypothetical protein